MTRYSPLQIDIPKAHEVVNPDEVVEWSEQEIKGLAHNLATSNDGYLPEVPGILHIHTPPSPYETTLVEEIHNNTDGSFATASYSNQEVR